MNKDEFISTALELTKARLGISTKIRDGLLKNAVESVVEELEKVQGVILNYDSPMHLDFVKDFATWRYQSVNDTQTVSTKATVPIPRHLQFRLHNLVIKQETSGD